MSAVVINIDTSLTDVPTIEVGKQGENGATQVVFDVSEMIETYGSGTAYVVVQRRGDAEPYLLDNTSQSGDTVTWTVSNVDTDVYGTGRVQLFWLINEQVAKTVTYQFYVEEALHDPQDAPVVPGGWISDEIGNLDNLTTTAKANLVAAINEVNSKAATNTTAIGTLANLTTTEKSNLVGAINEVDADVSDVKEDFNELEDNVIGYNPHYSYTIVKGEYVTTNGAFESYAAWDRTDYIPLVGSVLYVTITGSGNLYNCFYDANKSFISNFQTTTAGTASIELPPSAKYVVLSAGSGENWVLTANMPDNLAELDARVSNLESQTNGWSGKKWVSYGDSLTQGNTWQPIVASKFGLVHINKGVGGSSVADGQINGVVSMCNAERIAELPSDADIVTVMGGTNDYNLTNEGKGTPLGVFPTSSANYDTYTFYGAYLAMLQRIQQRCPNALILVMSCINSRGVTGQNETYCYQNQIGMTTPDYAKAAEDIARYTGSAFLDMEKCGITLFNRANFISDSVHPNAEGGKLMARMVISYLQTHQPV